MNQTELGGASPPALWDRVVRISHWGIAAVVFGNEVVTRGGSSAHVWIGWIGLGLMALRLVWGFVGPREARFAAFPPSPKRALAHLKDLLAGAPKAHGSHNPAGALMVYALWAALAVLIGTGIYMSGPSPLAVTNQEAVVNSNDWSGLVSDGIGADERSGGHLVKSVHEAMANLVLLLVSVHVAGVVIEGLAMRRNLVRPMLFGAGDRGK